MRADRQPGGAAGPPLGASARFRNARTGNGAPCEAQAAQGQEARLACSGVQVDRVEHDILPTGSPGATLRPGELSRRRECRGFLRHWR